MNDNEPIYIPDPIEILKGQIEDQCALHDKDGNYPCCHCGKYCDPNEMDAVSGHPAAPLICWKCLDEMETKND